MEEGICPICKKPTLEYGALEVQDNMIYYPWECTNCKHKGQEWYELTFVDHIIKG